MEFNGEVGIELLAKVMRGLRYDGDWLPPTRIDTLLVSLIKHASEVTFYSLSPYFLPLPLTVTSLLFNSVLGLKSASLLLLCIRDSAGNLQRICGVLGDARASDHQRNFGPTSYGQRQQRAFGGVTPPRQIRSSVARNDSTYSRYYLPMT